jgi:hypothetical protein
MTTTPFLSFAFPTADGSTSRTLPDRLAETFNVRDFGAVGDGFTDDHAAIMSAFNGGTVTLTTTASNVTASFTGSIAAGVLTASSVSGTLHVNDIVAYTGDLPAFLVVLTVNGGGTYNLTFDGSTVATGITRSSQAMFTVGRTLTFASVPTALTDLTYYSNHTRYRGTSVNVGFRLLHRDTRSVDHPGELRRLFDKAGFAR